MIRVLIYLFLFWVRNKDERVRYEKYINLKYLVLVWILMKCIYVCVCVCVFFKKHFSVAMVAFPMGLVQCSRESQTSFFNKIFIKNGFHGTIHIFKNYFVTDFQFSIFSKISGIQTHL